MSRRAHMVLQLLLLVLWKSTKRGGQVVEFF